MAGPLNQARAKISKIFNGEPQSYTLFNTAPDTDGDNSHVEVKLSGDGEEEMDPTELGHSRRPPGYQARPPRRPYKNICYFAGGVVFIFIIGYLIGYATHRSPQNPKTPEGKVLCVSAQPEEESRDEGDSIPPPEPSLDWADITKMLANNLSPDKFDATLRDFASEKHEAGSDGDEQLANKVFKIFDGLQMTPWTDEHYVQLQVPSKDNPNKVLFDSEEIGQPQGYLAYSATGTKKGKVMYANYGQMEDLKLLQSIGLNLSQSVLLMRAGQISFAEKVANAAKFEAAAVLIYREPANYPSTELYGHVHLGTGDPYTPGFPSFNHTQFPPAKSSGLPAILAQTITADMALAIHKKMGGKDAPENFKGNLKGLSKYMLGGGDSDRVNVTVNNVLVDTKIHNVFGVIKGFIDPDRYVVIGAQRDSFSWGYAKSTVGTSQLVELARAFTAMMKDGFKPRRSVLFASWSAGDYGSIGSTEWLEGYLTSLDRRAFSYISLDGTVAGANKIKASGSQLLYALLKQTVNEVKSPWNSQSLMQSFGQTELNLEPMRMEDGAYPFLAFSGIPSVSFRFVSTKNEDYSYDGTALDTKVQLDISTGHKTPELCGAAAQVAGQMALRMVHDHLLRLDVTSYTKPIRMHVFAISRLVSDLKTLSAPLTADWLISAQGSYSRAASDLLTEIQNSDLEDKEKCRTINDRMMRVEHNLLSPYVSPRDVPFRHILHGSGDHTLAALTAHLKDLKEKADSANVDLMRNQFAQATWTVQGCANDLVGDVWALDNEI